MNKIWLLLSLCKLLLLFCHFFFASPNHTFPCSRDLAVYGLWLNWKFFAYQILSGILFCFYRHVQSSSMLHYGVAWLLLEHVFHCVLEANEYKIISYNKYDMLWTPKYNKNLFLISKKCFFLGRRVFGSRISMSWQNIMKEWNFIYSLGRIWWLKFKILAWRSHIFFLSFEWKRWHKCP